MTTDEGLDAEAIDARRPSDATATATMAPPWPDNRRVTWPVVRSMSHVNGSPPAKVRCFKEMGVNLQQPIDVVAAGWVEVFMKNRNDSDSFGTATS